MGLRGFAYQNFDSDVIMEYKRQRKHTEVGTNGSLINARYSRVG